MKSTILLFIILFLTSIAESQERRLINIPDIPGYQTLVCDFHTHTVFSDGLVWPTVRVDEAWLEGLDAIAITDHLEYRPHDKEVISDHNRPWEIAKEYAKNKDVIVIAGTEITKGMPPGHFNALFIKDANAIYNDDYKKSIETAAGQGAFILWNHPGWKVQQPDTMRWWEEHTYLLQQGWMHGIEVSNEYEYYPEAIQWAADKNLTIFANSDVHEPIHMAFDVIGSHRTCTLVFSTERSEGGIREALFNGRTLAYFEDILMGKPELLQALLNESLALKKFENDPNHFSFVNPTDLKIEVHLENYIYNNWQQSLVINPRNELLFRIPQEADAEEIRVTFSNFLTGPEKPLTLLLSNIRFFNQ